MSDSINNKIAEMVDTLVADQMKEAVVYTAKRAIELSVGVVSCFSFVEAEELTPEQLKEFYSGLIGITAGAFQTLEEIRKNYKILTSSVQENTHV